MVATVYDSNGRVQKMSNPYRTTSDSTYGWQTPTYDGLNRTVQTLEADGSISKTYYGATAGSAGGLSTQLCTSSTYGLGYPVLTVDEAGKMRQSWTDGFGRLIEVDEPNLSGTLSVPTCYTYDLNNNLIGVAQSTVTRSFTYDLIPRLTTSGNSESGTINYYYTTSGGSLCSGDPSAVCRRTDAKSVTTTYSYDTLNRLTSKTYSDSTPTVSYSYDGTTCIGASPCYNKGRRTGMTDAPTGSESWSYDTMGRMWGDKRITNSVTNQTTYTYNLDGSLATLTYPSGRIISYTYNSAAQPTAAADNANEISYVSDGFYAPHGALGIPCQWCSLYDFVQLTLTALLVLGREWDQLTVERCVHRNGDNRDDSRPEVQLQFRSGQWRRGRDHESTGTQRAPRLSFTTR